VQSHKPKKHHASGHGRPATAGQGSQAPPHGRANGTTILNPHANGHGKSGPKGSNRSSGRAESTRRNNVTLPSLPVQPPQVDLPQLP